MMRQKREKNNCCKEKYLSIGLVVAVLNSNPRINLFVVMNFLFLAALGGWVWDMKKEKPLRVHGVVEDVKCVKFGMKSYLIYLYISDDSFVGSTSFSECKG